MSLSSPSLRCLSVLRKCYGSSTTGSHRRLLTTQSTEEVISPYIIHKASSSRRANTGSRGGVTSETNVEQDVRPATLAIPTLAENPRWILPIPEKPKRQLVSRRTGQRLKILPPPRSARKACPEPLKAANAAEIAKLDPTGARTRLFALDNPDAIQVRDVVMVRQKSGDPFAGVVLKIKRAAQNTGILLRNTITGTGVEMDFKIYSPNITGIEVVQRRPRKPKQHSLFYLRDPKHDIGSVDNIVRQYLRSKTALTDGRTVLKAGPRPQQKSQKGQKKK